MAAVTAGVVASVGSAYMQKKAGDKAASASRNAANQANAAQQAIYQDAQNNLNPFIQAGQGALGGINALNAGDYSGFQSSPDYVYARDQIQQGLERGAAARGSLYSGGTNVDLANALNGVASQNLGNYRNALMQQANQGLSATSALNSSGANFAGQTANNLYNSAAATGAAAQNSANQWGNALGTLGGAAYNYFANQGGGQSAYQPAPYQAQSAWGQSLANPGSVYGFGNNVNALYGWGR